MRLQAIILSLALTACGTGADESSTKNDCSLTFSTSPSQADELADAASQSGADVVFVPPEASPTNSTSTSTLEQGEISVFLCSDVLTVNDNELDGEIALDLARTGRVTYLELRGE